MSDIIKTTARFQETQGPLKQKPIIQMDNTLKVQSSLPNTIRASIDSGRDNPFRPDGKIYKSADPIVDFYKYGPNQSRPQSPADSQLLIQNGSVGGPDKKGKKGSKSSKTNNSEENSDERRGRSCWRRWFCCCCCCCGCKRSPCCRRKSSSEDPQDSAEAEIAIISHEIEPYEKQKAAKDANSKQTRLLILKGERESPSSGAQNRLHQESGPGGKAKALNIEFVDADKELSSIEDNKPKPGEAARKR